MPPRRPASINRVGSKNSASVTSTPKRTMRSYRARQKKTTPGSASLSRDELSTEVGACDTAQAGADEEVILDEIVVAVMPSETPKNETTANDVDLSSQAVAFDNSAQTPKKLRRSSRTSPISQGGGAVLSPSGRGVPIKKQDFPVGIAADDDGKPDELSDPPIAKKRKLESMPTKRVALRKSRSKWDNPDEMLTNPNSPLAKANLRELLCSPMAWDILTPEEKEKILAKFPKDAEILNSGTPNARPDIAALRNNNNFRHDVARYQEGLSKGYHDPEWIQQAQAAHRSREMGFYDEFMATDFEERWDMPMLQQPHAGSKTNGNDNRQAARALDGEVNDTPIELKTRVPSEAMTDQDRGRYTAGTLHEKSPEINATYQNEDFGDANGCKTELANISATKNRAQSLGFDDEKAEPAQVGAVSTQNSTDSGDQKTKDHNHNIEVSSTPSLPAMMEETEQQRKEEPPKINVNQDIGAVETAGKNSNAEMQAVITLTQPVEGLANGIQEQQDGNALLESKAVEQQHGGKQDN